MTTLKWTVAFCLTAGMAQAQDLNTMTTDELMAQAKTEATVVVYSFTSRIARVEEAFEAAYPGIDLQGFDISST